MNWLKWVDIFYLILLGATLGLVLTLGVIVAPVIFNSNHYLNQQLLTHYQMGLLMTSIFLKGNYWLNTTAIAILLREGYAYKSFQRDKIILPSAATAVAMIFLFTLFYTKEIITLQAQGEEATASKTFQSLHDASELTFKLLALSLFLLLARRLYLGLKDRYLG